MTLTLKAKRMLPSDCVTLHRPLRCGSEVTSSSWSPYQDCGVSIIRFYEANLSKGLVLDVLDNQNKNLKGYICELPMYDEKGEIVRGIKAKIPTEPSSWKPN